MATGGAAAMKMALDDADAFVEPPPPGGGGGSGEPDLDRLSNVIKQFNDLFVKTGVEHFGSGWVWLCAARDGGLKVTATHDAKSPLLDDLQPLLCCDLWEHAYYLDYQNDREGFLHDFLGRLANWPRASEIFGKAAQVASVGKVSHG